MNNTIKTLSLLMISSLAFGSCTETVDIGGTDESRFAGANSLVGYFQDLKSGKPENVVELYDDEYSTSIAFGMTKAPGFGIDVVAEYDSEYAGTYNSEHGTDFKLFPQENIEIGENGRILVAPDEKMSYGINLTIRYSDVLEDNMTYILPIRMTSETEGIELPESASHGVYLIKNCRNTGNSFKGEDAVKTFLFFEVNDTNPLNALLLQLETGEMFLDYVVLFAANINYNSEKGKVYLSLNPNVKFLLDNNEQYLQPLRKKGIKVILGVLGNRDQAGLAQLSELGAREFAKDLASYVYAYNLDGVNFDDEYSDDPDLDNPLFAPKSTAAAARLCFETKKLMPDKVVSVYIYGAMYGVGVVDGIDAGQWCDIAVANYGGGAAFPLEGMTKKNCAGFSLELNQNYEPESTFKTSAQKVKDGGYGYYMIFAPFSSSKSDEVKKKQHDRLSEISEVLYGSPLKPFTSFYDPEKTETRSLL